MKNIRNMNSQYDRVLSFKEGYLQSNIKFKDYNGNEQRLKVVDFKNIENNILDVARQVRSENNDKVFDVLILLNGFPFCLMELKYEKDLWSAYYQIDHEYKNEINNDAFFRFISVFACVRPEEARYYSNIEQNEKNSAGV
ncbi:MAG: type I restriction endonuclease, partial [Lactobacillus iners]|nr:type I restriction endonuclease [Lactobacillus iners]